jgi:serine/threonine protein kinase
MGCEINVGLGSLGIVHRLRENYSGQMFAMKKIYLPKDMHNHSELEVRKVPPYSPFVAGRKFVWRNKNYAFLLQNYVHGGELFKRLPKRERFTEREIRFYLAEILLGLEDIHRCDSRRFYLRPRKILLDSLGHIVLSDFGLSRTSTEVFDVPYEPPEAVSHGVVDHRGNFWTLGVLLFEMSVGFNQFYHLDRQTTIDTILKYKVTLPEQGLFQQKNGRDLCQRLLERDPSKRLGAMGGIQEIKNHPFFAGIDWDALREKKITPPIKPAIRKDFDDFLVYEAETQNLLIEQADTSNGHSETKSTWTSLKRSSLAFSATSGSKSSYQTATSHITSSLYATPSSRQQSFARGSGSMEKGLLSQLFVRPDGRQRKDTPYTKLLQERGLILPPTEELDWSGKGQHVEFQLNEEIPLKPLNAIGHGGSAIVDGVLCRRIKLARKVMTCNRRQKLETVINEVEHLQHLRHPHIIQLVGSYLQGKRFAILLYPVADWNLASFYELCSSDNNSSPDQYLGVLPGFFQCLAHALAYVHANTMKHLDIKPQNVLVRRICLEPQHFNIYL